MSDKAIWITVESGIPAQELKSIRDLIADTELGERYEIIVLSDDVDTIDMDDLRQLIEDE